MKTLYLDCVSGIAGDMFLSALLDLGVLPEVVTGAVERVAPSEVTFSFEAVTSGGMRSLRTTVCPTGKTGQLRRLPDIEKAIQAAGLAEGVRDAAVAVFRALAGAEAAAHGVPLDEVHFHEVGAWDSIADIVGVCAALDALGVDEVVCSSLPLGCGTVRTEHGLLPVPAPATLELVKGLPVSSGPCEGELTTPTGAALARVLSTRFGRMPDMVVQRVGCGAGHREIPGRPNVLRLVLGELPTGGGSQDEWLMATNLDDCSPQVVASALERLFQEGALDAWCTPIQMKKNRPGVQVSLLCRAAERDRLRRVLFRETTAIGVREQLVIRTKLPREWVPVTTRFGTVRMKACRLDGEVVNAAPEFEDARHLAEANAVPVRVVLAEAMAAFRAVEGVPEAANPPGEGAGKGTRDEG
ncbi:MAG: nickel pincer cofactor biosynthesis protein LarC [Deltaproteobacteria bacterium]|nr:nickel pincer cofactor biosynthesis protein LarC [Deltaproteobacteria bacterium]